MERISRRGFFGRQAAAPVFVDASGHRLRMVRLALLALAGVITVYVGLIVIGLLGGPQLATPIFPSLTAPQSAPQLHAPSVPRTASHPVPTHTTTSPRSSRVPVSESASNTAAVTNNSQTAGGALPTTTITRPPAGTSQQAATPAPVTPAVAASSSTTTRGRSSTAPGQGNRPAHPIHP